MSNTCQCKLPNDEKPNIANVLKGSLVSSLINAFVYSTVVISFFLVTESYFHFFNIKHKGLSVSFMKTLLGIPILKYIFAALIGFPFESIFILILIGTFSYHLYQTLIYDNLKNFYPYTNKDDPSLKEDEDRYFKLVKSLFKSVAPIGLYILVLVGVILVDKFLFKGLEKFKFILYLIWFIGLIMVSVGHSGGIIINYFNSDNKKIDSKDKNGNTKDLVMIFTMYSIYLYAKCIGFNFNRQLAKNENFFTIFKSLFIGLFFYLMVINILFFLVNFIQGFYLKMWHFCK